MCFALGERALEATECILGAAELVQRPAEIVLDRRDPAPRTRVARAPRDLERALGPFDLTFGRLDDREHVRGVGGEVVESGSASERERVSEMNARSAWIARRVHDAAALEVVEHPRLDRRSGNPIRDGIELRVRFGEPALEPERARELRPEHERIVARTGRECPADLLLDGARIAEVPSARDRHLASTFRAPNTIDRRGVGQRNRLP
jgi:hypothetical protein